MGNTRELELAALPVEWLITLEQAAQEVNPRLLREAIEYIREHDAAPDALAQLTNDND